MITCERFWAKVQKTEACWLWLASKQELPHGYGYFRFDGRTQSAHRVAYQLVKGPIPTGLWVLHTCDNAECVNPDHLYLGTHADNTADMVRRNRCARGERHGLHIRPEATLRGDQCSWRTLNESDVREIRASYGPNCSQSVLAKQYGVTQPTISAVLLRKKWRHV